jgi:LysM repeat protein
MMFNAKGALLIAGGVCGLLLTGCVMAEKYEAEKARSLNFQRLLAQEEKRTGELDAEVKRVKREAADTEARSREMKAQIEALREQLARIQEEAVAFKQKEQDRSRDKEMSDIRDLERDLEQVIKPKRGEGKRAEAKRPERMAPKEAEPSDELDLDRELAKASSGLGKQRMQQSMEPPAGGKATYHVVKRGETLFRIAKNYGVSVDQLKEWNNLPSNAISVGQKLVVGHE